MTGFTATMETPVVGSAVFYDRTYVFDSLGSSTGRSPEAPGELQGGGAAPRCSRRALAPERRDAQSCPQLSSRGASHPAAPRRAQSPCNVGVKDRAASLRRIREHGTPVARLSRLCSLARPCRHSFAR